MDRKRAEEIRRMAEETTFEEASLRAADARGFAMTVRECKYLPSETPLILEEGACMELVGALFDLRLGGLDQRKRSHVNLQRRLLGGLYGVETEEGEDLCVASYDTASLLRDVLDEALGA